MSINHWLCIIMRGNAKMNCPIREKTADGVSVGRCWFHLPDGNTCPRHGDVSEAVKQFKETDKLTDEVLK